LMKFDRKDNKFLEIKKKIVEFSLKKKYLKKS
jgi:hypothetical protein